MADIVQTIVGDNALRLGNEEFVRPLSFGTNWNFLRIGCRLAFNGTANITTARFHIGLCVGSTDTFKSDSCVQHVGGAIGPGGPRTLVYDSVNLAYYATSSYNGSAVQKVGTTITDYTCPNGGYAEYFGATSAGRTSVFWSDFKKIGGNQIIVRNLFVNGAVPYANVPTFWDMLYNMEDQEIATDYAKRFSYDSVGPLTSTQTVTCTRVDMDTLSIYWNKASPTVELSDVCVLRYC